MSGKQMEAAPVKVCEKADGEQVTRSYFHPAFYAGMQLTLADWGDDIKCHKEFDLNTMANRIDFLAVKREGAVRKDDELCAIFRTYNLFEYKSPNQELGMASYDMVMGYVHLYKAYVKVGTEEQFTVSFVRERKPLKLMEELRDRGFLITEYADGIYHVKKDGHIDMQIVVTRDLNDKYDWIKLLTDKVTKEDLQRLAGKASKLRNAEERLAAQSVLELIKKQNEDKEWFMKEVFGMSGIRDWFQEEFDAKDKVITDLNEQLHNQEEQLKDKDKLIAQLQKEMENLKKQLLKSTAVF